MCPAPIYHKEYIMLKAANKEEQALICATLDIVTQWSGIDADVIMSACRQEPVVNARHYVIILLMDTGLFSNIGLGRIINRDHSTILYAKVRHHTRMQTDKNYRVGFENVREAFQLLPSSESELVRKARRWKTAMEEYRNAKENADRMVQELSIYDGRP